MGETISISTLADHLQASRETVFMILKGRQSISPDMALRLAAAFYTSSEVWMNMQTQYDLLLAEKKDRPSIGPIRKQPVGPIDHMNRSDDIIEDEVDEDQQLAEDLAERLSLVGASHARFKAEIDGEEYVVTVERMPKEAELGLSLHSKPGILIRSQADELCMTQLISGSPLEEFDELTDAYRLINPRACFNAPSEVLLANPRHVHSNPNLHPDTVLVGFFPISGHSWPEQSLLLVVPHPINRFTNRTSFKTFTRQVCPTDVTISID